MTTKRSPGAWSLALVVLCGAQLCWEGAADAACTRFTYAACLNGGNGCQLFGECNGSVYECSGTTQTACVNSGATACTSGLCDGTFGSGTITDCAAGYPQYSCAGLQPRVTNASCVQCTGCAYSTSNYGAVCPNPVCCGDNICVGVCQADPVTPCTSAAVTTTCTNGTCITHDGIPACVVLASVTSFTAVRHAAGTTLRWTTGAEKHNLGFNVYRADAAGKVLGKVNATLVTGPISSIVGAEYSVVDPKGKIGDRYVLESIDARFHADRSKPVAAVAGAPLPVASRELDLLALRARTLIIGKDLADVRRANLRQVVRGLNPSGGVLYNTIPSEKLGLRLKVQSNGLYRVTVKELEQAGLKVAGLTQDKLSFTAFGKAVPFRASASPLGAGDFIEFYGQENPSPQTSATVYFLSVASDASAKMPEKPSAPETGKSFAAQYDEALQVQENKIYQWGKNLSDPFYWAWLMPSTPLFETSFTADSIAAGTTTFRFSGKIDGITNNPKVSPDHHVKIFLNGTLVKDATWDGAKLLSFDEELPISSLKEGANKIRVEQINDTGSAYDLSAVDGFVVRYPRKLVAKADVLAFSTSGSDPNISVAGFTKPGIEVYDITVPESPTRLTSVDVQPVGGSYTAAFARPAGSSKYLAVTTDNAKGPAAIEQRFGSDLLAKTNEADLLVISYDAFAPALSPLVDLRRAQGRRVAVVTTGEIYDTFSHGNVSDKAIKDFIAYAAASWRQPGLGYVLLVGDTSNDLRDELKLGRLNYVPSHFVPSQSWGGVTSDNWYVDLKDQGRYDIGIGRLTVQTLGDATAAVTKAVAYDKATALPLKGANRVIVVADTSTPGTAEKFEAQAQAILAEIPSKYSKVGFYFKDYTTAEEAGTALLKELNQGSLLVIYIGHGSGLSWGSGGEFISKMIPQLATDVHAPLVISLSCVTGYLGYPGLEIFSQAFVKPADRGAISAWSTSDAGSALIYEALGKSFVRSLFKNSAAPVGDAVRAALNETVASSKEPAYRQTTDTFIYFGDPLQKLHLMQDVLPATDGRTPGSEGGNNVTPGGTAGCGCQISGLAGAGWTVITLLILGAFLVLRRRSR